MIANRIRALMMALAMIVSSIAGAAFAAGPASANDDLQTVATSKSFADLQTALEAAVADHGMFVVTRACASCGAAKRGVDIPGNMVLGVYRNDFAVRMLDASLLSGIEAPIRFYLTENDDGSAALSYRLPSAVFAPYGSSDLDVMAQELDAIWEKILNDTIE